MRFKFDMTPANDKSIFPLNLLTVDLINSEQDETGHLIFTVKLKCFFPFGD